MTRIFSSLARAHLVPPAEAYYYYDRAYQSGDRSADVYHGLFDGHMARGEYSEASQIARDAHGDYPRDAQWLRMAESALDAQRRIAEAARAARDDAIRSADAALSPRQREALNEARIGYRELRDAIRTYSDSMDWQHGPTLAYVADGMALNEAVRHTRAAVALAPQSAQYLLQLALIRILQGNYKDAVFEFDRAERVDPNALSTWPSYAYLRRFAEERARGGHSLKLLDIEPVAPVPPPAR